MIVITTPTGKIGGKVLSNLLNTNEPLRVIVRDASRLPANLPKAVEVVLGSHGTAAVVNQAFAGADTVLWVVPPYFKADSLEQAYTGFTQPAAAAIAANGVKRVVVVSAIGRGWPRPTGYIGASLAMSDLIASTGVSCRALLMPGFMDNVLRQVQSIKEQGVFFGSLDPDRTDPYCSTEDIATVATEWLRDTSWTGQQDSPVLGPEDLSCNDMAAILSDVLGKPVRYQQISFDALKAQALDRGASEAMAQGMVDMMVAKNEGLDYVLSRTPEATTPTTFRQWCDETLKPAVLG